MMSFSIRFCSLLTIFACLLIQTEFAFSEEISEALAKEEVESSEDAKTKKNVSEIAAGDSSGGENGKPAKEEPPKYPPVAKVLKDTKSIDGLIKLHYSDQKLFAELKPGDFDKDHIVLITIARGIGQNPILGGFSWGFGDDWVWQFRRVGENIQIVRRNVRFRAKEGTPTAEAVKLAYTDSVMYSLPIVTKNGPNTVINLTPVFLSDLPQLSQSLPGYAISKQRSTFLEPKGYDKNVEIQVAATYASSGTRRIESVADARAATVNVHYSISRLPKTDYRPREADDRVGYFLTAIKDFSKKTDDGDRFVRYINRWNLQKVDPQAEVSTPKEPIKFWLEKTIPFKYRKPIRDGIEEWNKAFEKAGYYDAIDVEQQPNDATWDPGDINYNTFRWITSNAGFAMGPSRTNPLTGQILDADIIFDSDFLTSWKREYETFTPRGIEIMTGGAIDLESYRKEQANHAAHRCQGHSGRCSCSLLSGASQQIAFGHAMATVRKQSPEQLEKLVMQALKEVTMHEVGHTLGLRHNFKASTLHSVEDLQDADLVAKEGITASVMDYTPVVIMPEGMKQTDYFSRTIGPYDYWAIEYGYKQLKDEKEELAKIASRSGERGLAFSTDEDTRGIDPDPHSKRFDLSSDLVEYAELQAKLIGEVMPNLIDEFVEDGDGYQKPRQAFGLLLSRYGAAMFNASRYVGGVYVNRSHKGDPNGPEPFVIVDVKKQREALMLIEEHVFCPEPFSIPGEVYNKLASSKWNHWGVSMAPRPDYPVHSVILNWQKRVMDQLLGNLTLSRIQDSEYKIPADEDAFTNAELFERMTDIIFDEVINFQEGEYTNRKPAINSLRRNLQRSYLEKLASIAMDRTSAPADCQTLAYAELKDLKEEIDKLLKGKPELDRYTEAHLDEISDRLGKLLETDQLVSGSGGFSLFL